MSKDDTSITLSSKDNPFERARKMLRGAGLVGAERTGLDTRLAEIVMLYQQLDEEQRWIGEDDDE